MGVGKSASLFAPPRVITGKYFHTLGVNTKQDRGTLGKLSTHKYSIKK